MVRLGQGRRAGGRAAAQAVDIPGQNPLVLYKNNTDNKGASYGAHENYLMKRATPFPDIIRHLTPFFVTRQIDRAVPAGSASDRTAHTHEFQISQRADYFEVEVGLETTLKRPIINTRDEPHADPERYRRLHVIIGDANMAEISCYLKVGTTVAGAVDDRGRGDQRRPQHRRPCPTLHQVSHDPTLQHLLTLKDGRIDDGDRSAGALSRAVAQLRRQITTAAMST